MLFDPVYITLTSSKLIGDHFFASSMSKSRNEIIPAFFTTITHATQTVDWIVRSKKFIEKSRPDTTNYKPISILPRIFAIWTHALLTTVMRMEAQQ